MTRFLDAIGYDTVDAGTLVLFVLFNLIQPTGWTVGLVRIEDVAIGFGISLGVGLLFWPRGAGNLLRENLASAYARSADYVVARAHQLVVGPDAARSDDQAQLAAQAVHRVDDAFRQYLAERSARKVNVESIGTLVAGAARVRRAAQSLSALGHSRVCARGRRRWKQEKDPSGPRPPLGKPGREDADAPVGDSHHVIATEPASAQSFLLQRVQPAMTGLIDGSLSTLAPIFAVALATHQPHYAFFAGLATAIGAGVSMAFSEGLSDTGEVTGRGSPFLRGSITGTGTFLGGIFHTLPFLIPQNRTALVVTILVIAVELVALAWIRERFFAEDWQVDRCATETPQPFAPDPSWLDSGRSSQENHCAMKQVLVVFRLHEGSEPEAARLAAADLPFDPEEAGFKRLAIYLGHREVIFVLEGEDPEWSEDDLVSDFLQPALRERLDEWRKLADVQTWPAQPIFFWEASGDE